MISKHTLNCKSMLTPLCYAEHTGLRGSFGSRSSERHSGLMLASSRAVYGEVWQQPAKVRGLSRDSHHNTCRPLLYT